MTQTKNLAERSGTVCVTKWWCRMGKKGWEVVSLRGLVGWLSPGHKQVRYDSSRPSFLKPHSSSPVSKTVPFLRQKNTVGFIFLSPHNEFCFVAFLLSLFLVSILLVFSWPGQVPVQNCSKKNPTVISQESSENSFALIQCTKILKNIKKWQSIHIGSIFSKLLHNKNNNNG